MALPVPSSGSDHHVADDGGLEGLAKASGGHAAGYGPCGLDIDARGVFKAFPPDRNPGEVRGLQGLVHEAVGRALPPPLRCTDREGVSEADALQQPPEAEEGPVLDRALPDLGKGCVAPHPPDQGAALPPLAEGDPDRVRRLARQDQVHEEPDLGEPRAPVGRMHDPPAKGRKEIGIVGMGSSSEQAGRESRVRSKQAQLGSGNSKSPHQRKPVEGHLRSLGLELFAVPTCTLCHSKVLQGRNDRQLQGRAPLPLERVAVQDERCGSLHKVLPLEAGGRQPHSAVSREDLGCLFFGRQAVKGQPDRGGGGKGQHIHDRCTGLKFLAEGCCGLGCSDARSGIGPHHQPLRRG